MTISVPLGLALLISGPSSLAPISADFDTRDVLYAPSLAGQGTELIPSRALTVLAGVRPMTLENSPVVFRSAQFTQWNAMLTRYEAAKISDGEGWSALAKMAASIPIEKRISWVNRIVNRVRYSSDLSNWSHADFWETPQEFFKRGGDCEDYAIAKYLLLVESGFPTESLKIAVMQNHSVLLVDSERGMLVLDNNSNAVRPVTRRLSKRFIFTINDDEWVFSTSDRSS